MATATAQEIVDRASNELGIATSSLEPGLITQVGTQSLALMNGLGDDLVNAHDWQFLEGTATIQGDGVTSEFDLPADFGRIVNQTVWSANMRIEAMGPMSPQQWGWIQFGIISIGVYFRYRILNNKMQIFPTPGVGDTLNFYYIKKNWVIDSFTGGTIDKILRGGDTPVFDRNLMIKGVKVRLWGQKGFDTTELSKEFNDSLSSYIAQSAGAPAIRLSRSQYYYLIDPYRNVKDGSW